MTRKKSPPTAPHEAPPLAASTRALVAVIAETARRAVLAGADPRSVVDAVVAATTSTDVAALDGLTRPPRPTIEVVLLRDGVPVPGYRTEGAVAWDVAYPGPKPVTIEAGRKVMLNSGLRIHIPDPDVGAFLHPRSSTGWRGLALANTTGVIDPDFQGELRIALRNTRRRKPITIMPGDRVAQLVFVPVVRFDPIVREAFTTETSRAHGAFGSTGR